MANLKLKADSGSTNYTFASEVDGVTYNFFLMYNQRSLKWYLNVSTQDGDEIYSGVPVLADTLLLTAVVENAPTYDLFGVYVNIIKGE